MAQTWRNFGHIAPAGAIETAVTAAVPSATTWEVKVWITNRTAGVLTFRVRQAFANAADATDQYRAYDAPCPANDIVVLPIFVMNATDVLYFKQSAVGLTCIADGLVIT